MSKIITLWESTSEAEGKVELLLSAALARLQEVNQRLIELVIAIKKAQPKSRSVCLELYPCSTKGCRGCPHPRWVRYTWKPHKDPSKRDILIAVNLSAAKREPILTLERKAPHYKATATLIREAKALIEKKSTIIAGLKRLDYAIA